jgi:riboflavin transporter 2
MIPSILALVQGIGENSDCVNVTINGNTTLEPVKIIPRYSVKIYFLLMFTLLFLSTIAFTLLNYTKVAKSSRRKDNINKRNENIHEITIGDNVIISSPIYNQIQNETVETLEPQSPRIDLTQKEKYERIVLLMITFSISFIYYGVLPGIQTYSSLPYGNTALFLSINLSNLNFNVTV